MLLTVVDISHFYIEKYRNSLAVQAKANGFPC